MMRMNGASAMRFGRDCLASMCICRLRCCRKFENSNGPARRRCVRWGGRLRAPYLDRLQTAVSQLGLPQLHVMGSSGGVLDIDEALRMPAMAVESGPAAGVVAASLARRQLDRAK